MSAVKDIGTRAEPLETVEEPAKPQSKSARWVTLVAQAVGLLAAIFHLYTGATAPLPALEHRVVHLTFGLIIAFLVFSKATQRESKLRRLWDFLLVGASVASGLYIVLNSQAIQASYQPSTFQILVAFVLTALVLEGTRRTAGPILPIIGIVAILYAMFGQNMGGIFQHSGSSVGQIARNLALSTEGILGVALGVSATYVVLFVLFGALLQLSGAGDFMLRLAELTTGQFRGGTAKGATVASGLFGSISGSPVGNVASTGPVTLPLMKSAGFKPKTAAAVEASASTGGMIMPPVMGAAAFLIAEILAIPYAEVVVAALIPALLYYVALLFTIDAHAARYGIAGKPVERALRAVGTLLTMRGYQLLPLAVLLYMLVVEGTTAGRAAYWGLVVATVIAVIAAFLGKRGKEFPKQFALALSEAFRSMVVIIMACGTAGIVMGMMAATGLGFRLSYILTELAGNNVVILLILTMVASIILGMSLPAVAAYLVLAVTVAPALTELGVEPLAAHLFVLYFGVLSNITPPVGLAAFAAAGIAGAKPQATSFEALRFALSGFLIPFLFVFSPALLMNGSGVEITLAVVMSLTGLLAMSAAVIGYLGGQLNWPLRIVLGLAGVCLVVPEIWSGLIGGSILLAVYISKKISSNKGKNSVEV